MASSLVARRQSAFFRAFLPRAAVRALVATRSAGRLAAAGASATELLATETEAAVLVVDISGFTRLCDRFQALGPGGVDALTASINRVFGVLLAHIAACGGDVVRFVGDALIVMWEAGDPDRPPPAGGAPAGRAAGLAAAVARAVACARELERRHGAFEVRVPDPSPPALADQLCRHVATVGGGDAGGAARVDERDVDIVDRLRGVPALCVANEAAARRLAAACACVAFRAGDVIVRQGEPADAVHVLHAGEARVSRSPGRPAAVFGAPGAPPPPPPAAAAYVAYAREGAAIGLDEALAGVPHGATAVATRSCVVLRLPAAAVQRAALRAAGPAAVAAGKDGGAANDSDTLTLRIHQVQL